MDKMDINAYPYTSASRDEMTSIHIDFTWCFDTKGYRPKGGRLVRNGGDLQAYRPLELYPTLFKIFSECRSEKNVVDFVSKFGPLITSRPDLIMTRALGLPAVMAARGDSIREVIQQAKWMAKLLSNHKADTPQIPLTSLEAFLVTGRGEIRLKLSPSRLIDGLWLQAAQSITSGRDLQECLHCGELFEVGPGSGRRLDAKFCKDEHRIAFNNRRRREAL